MGVEHRTWLFSGGGSGSNRLSPKGLQIIKINNIPVEYERRDTAKSILLTCLKKKKKLIELMVRANPCGYQSCKTVSARCVFVCRIVCSRESNETNAHLHTEPGVAK